MEINLPVIAEGTLDLCPHQGCDHTCCEFVAGNFIALYPGELAAARSAGHPTEHLQLQPDGHGGHRAVCRARDKSHCDGGYKPLDCASYPLFPTVTVDGKLNVTLKGSKCPLQLADLDDHQAWVARRWRELAAEQPELLDWLRTVKLIGYELVN